MTAAVLTLKDPWVGYYTTSPPAPSLPTSHLSLEETSEKEMCPQRSLCVLLFSFRRVVFSSSLSPPRQRYSPQGGSLGTWQHIKREGSWPRVGIWLQPDFGHGLRLIGAVKRTRLCVCERMCLCECEPYLKCENTSRINVRLQYVWRELRGNLHLLVLLDTPHEGKKKLLSWRPPMTICPRRRAFSV